MALNLHTIKSDPSTSKPRKTIGRGGKRGTYSGRGIKGQRSRSGGKRGTARRGLRQLIERTHKLKGFKSIHPKPAIVSLAALSKKFQPDETVNPQELLKRKLVDNIRNGVKILSNGEINVKIKVENCHLSKVAAAKIIKVGGTIKPLSVKKDKPAAGQSEDKIGRAHV